jgi:hypothetical protein
MRLLRCVLPLASVAAALIPSIAHAEDASCFPACRRGYLCHAGTCVSECNPPCGAGETCEAAQCVLRTSAAPPTTKSSSSPSSTSSEITQPDKAEKTAPTSRELPSVVMNLGPGMLIAQNTVPTLALGVRYQMPTAHAFVAGGRFVLALPEGTDFFVVGADVGYSGTFYRGDVDAGLLALAQPQVWVGGSDALLYMGGAVGPFIRYGHFQAELLVGGGFATMLEDPYQGRSRDLGGVGTVGLVAGFAF